MDFLVSGYGENSFITYYVWGLVIILGLVIGSFLNVVGLRLLSGESIVFPPSKCPKCNTKLKWYDNIPVLAYLLLGGKCRYCKEKISFQYPLVEIITSLILFLIFLKFSFSIETLLFWIFACEGIVMCITDFKEQVIFEVLPYSLIVIGLIFSFFNLGNFPSSGVLLFNTAFSLSATFVSSIIGIVGALAFFEIISFVSKLILGQRAFGEGDTLIAMAFGAWFGWQILIAIIVLSVIVQVVMTLPLLIFKTIKSKDKTAILSFLILLFSVIIPLVLRQTDFSLTSMSTFCIVIFLLIVAIICAFIFLKRQKELNSFTIVPFGPALIMAGLLVIFFPISVSNIIDYIGL